MGTARHAIVCKRSSPIMGEAQGLRPGSVCWVCDQQLLHDVIEDRTARVLQAESEASVNQCWVRGAGGCLDAAVLAIGAWPHWRACVVTGVIVRCAMGRASQAWVGVERRPCKATTGARGVWLLM